MAGVLRPRPVPDSIPRRTPVAAQGRVAVALTWGGRAALERRLVTSAPPPPPPDSSPSIPTARWTGSSPDVNWFRARADFADY